MEANVYNHFEIYLLAILLEALMGLKRESRKTRVARLRTFILVVLFEASADRFPRPAGAAGFCRPA